MSMDKEIEKILREEGKAFRKDTNALLADKERRHKSITHALRAFNTVEKNSPTSLIEFLGSPRSFSAAALAFMLILSVALLYRADNVENTEYAENNSTNENSARSTLANDVVPYDSQQEYLEPLSEELQEPEDVLIAFREVNDSWNKEVSSFFSEGLYFEKEDTLAPEYEPMIFTRDDFEYMEEDYEEDNEVI